jgi:hypothetical protein
MDLLAKSMRHRPDHRLLHLEYYCCLHYRHLDIRHRHRRWLKVL